ncbi:AraC family transcriptional regulator [Paenibacillus sp. MSJ-34]|uniref:AraC family transcriptional regulator n=1 Tax=Paenibacillus sp. MSJ-34 TaxID=2841529 RepID=UPI001C11BBE2|nr:AraC family transcriptional regulator [Paenibacillus sp. MSJ-34]MBU5444523.1 AraC family transcriptional regulator [Paenibacillus sp. MSJ-34]
MNRFTPKQMYIRIFLLLSIVFSLIIIPFTLFLSHQFSKYAAAEINKLTNDKLNQTLESTEFMLKKLKAYGLSMYEDQNIQNWLVSETKDPMLATAAMQAMTNWLSNESFIFDAYMINIRTGEAIDSRKGIHSLDSFYDQGIVDKIRNDRPKFLQYFNHEVVGESHMALIVPSNPSRHDYNGYLAILLDNRLLQKYLLQFNQEIGIEVVVLDRQGNMIMGPLNSELSMPVLSSSKNDRSGMFHLDIDGEQWAVNYAEMKSQPWTMYYLTGLGHLKSEVTSFQRKIVISSLVLLFVLLAFIFWNSRRTYRPFSQLAMMIKGKIGEELGTSDSSRNGEYAVIRQGIETMAETMDKINRSIRNHRHLIDGEYLRQWILHGHMNEPIREYILKEFDLLTYKYIQLAAVRIDSYSSFTEKYTFASRKLMKYAMGNIAVEIVRSRNWSGESVDFGGDHLIVLLGRNERTLEETLEVFGEIAEQIEKWLDIRVIVGISDPRDINDEIRSVYDYIYELTLLKFITGSGKVYGERDFEQYSDLVQPLQDDSMLEELIQNVRLGRVEKMKVLLDRIIEQMQTLTYAECKFRLTLILYTLMKAFKQWRFLKTVDGIQNHLDRFGTLNEVRDWLYVELQEIVTNMGRRKSSGRKEELVTEIVEYVQNRIHDPMLSAEDISAHLSLSVSYTRQVFKEVYHSTLSDFIWDQRMKNVIKLLETTTWSIADIAERSGYQTKSHFYTAFKKTTGMTPSEYRQQSVEYPAAR